MFFFAVLLASAEAQRRIVDGRGDILERQEGTTVVVTAEEPTVRCVSAEALTMGRKEIDASEPTAGLTWLVEAVDLERRQGECLVPVELEVARALKAAGQDTAAAQLARHAHIRATTALHRDTAMALIDTFDRPSIRLVVQHQTVAPMIDVRGLAPPRDDIALRVCTHLEDYHLVSCSPGGAVFTDVPTGPHILTTRVYGLPSGREITALDVPLNVSSNDTEKKEKIFFDDVGKDAPELLVLTLVLNGMPFLTRHYGVLRETKLRFEWHVVEGLAIGRADASRPYSSRPLPFHKDGLSIDGTTEYLDNLAETDDRVIVTRNCRTDGILRCAWTDKIAMCNEALRRMTSGKKEQMILQVDADELWSATQILAAYDVLMQQSEVRCAFFHCHFLVGPNLATATPGGYGHSNGYEWLRAWKASPGHVLFTSHAPPTLIHRNAGGWETLGRCLDHATTARAGAVFTHYAYVTKTQVAFKEAFYGYSGAISGWTRLQTAPLPANLSDFLPWAFKNTLVDRPGKAAFFGDIPLNEAPTPAEAQKEIDRVHTTQETERQVVVIDCVAFQRKRSGGIRRVWSNILPKLVEAFPLFRFVVLERAGAACSIDGVEALTAPPFPESHDHVADALVLGMLCRRVNAAVFISTEYTAPFGDIRRLLLVHDATPEKFNWTEAYWDLKRAAMTKADAVVAVSNATATAINEAYPDTKVVASQNGVDLNVFRPLNDDAHRRYGVSRPYVLVVGPRTGYKNGISLFRALYHARATSIHLWLVGPAPTPEELKLLTGSHWNLSFTHTPWLPDADLAAAYSSATALAYLSRDEGFGLPILEALASGCPVLASRIPAHVDLLQDIALPGCADLSCGAVLVDPPDRMTAIWHGLRALFHLDPSHRIALRTSLRNRARAFQSWDPLATAVGDQLSRLVLQ